MNRGSMMAAGLAACLTLAGSAFAREPKLETTAPDAKSKLKMEESDRKPNLPVGSEVPDFKLKDSAGKEVDLAEYRGDGILVVTFLSAKCPVSHALHPSIAEVAAGFGKEGVKFVGIMSNSTEKTVDVATEVRKQGIDFPILDDPGNKIADAFDAVGTPHMFIIDKAGVLKFSGAFCDNWKELDKAEKFFFKDALKAVVAGEEPADPTPEAFIGCSIKRVKSAG